MITNAMAHGDLVKMAHDGKHGKSTLDLGMQGINHCLCSATAKSIFRTGALSVLQSEIAHHQLDSRCEIHSHVILDRSTISASIAVAHPHSMSLEREKWLRALM